MPLPLKRVSSLSDEESYELELKLGESYNISRPKVIFKQQSKWELRNQIYNYSQLWEKWVKIQDQDILRKLVLRGHLEQS